MVKPLPATSTVKDFRIIWRFSLYFGLCEVKGVTGDDISLCEVTGVIDCDHR